MAAVENQTEVVGERVPESAVEAFSRVRAATLAICEPLEIEDHVVQSMPDASPLKWHLAHTSWFFEQFLLKAHLAGYRAFHPRYDYLFNSYYQGIGAMHERPERGLLTRPTVVEVLEYRMHVEAHMQRLLEMRAGDDVIAALTTLGLHHEQQHQELMFTDLKHLFSRNPLLPAYRPSDACAALPAPVGAPRFEAFAGGIQEIGTNGPGFYFDNESPRHRTWLAPFALSQRLVTNSEYREFLRAGGYRRAEFWLADGWSTVQREQWTHPLYWDDALDAQFTLAGLQPLNPAAPVCHLSFYEADAFARWAGARLPTEAEWETASGAQSLQGNFQDSGLLQPMPSTQDQGMTQMFGDVWEWTASPYVGYPGYRSAPGALGEYNGKFMCNQWVLRGGSCVTPADHVRATYRNFFYPHTRWQFAGVRLARDD